MRDATRKTEHAQVPFWTCPACNKVTVIRTKGESDQLRKIEMHLEKFHETNGFLFFQQFPIEDTMRFLNVTGDTLHHVSRRNTNG